jgi:hypothetical protein
LAVVGKTIRSQIGAGLKLRQLIRTRETEIRARRVDARTSQAQIVILDHRSADQLL